MRSAYRCRAYPDEAQQVMLARTFGCVRVVWNLTLAARRARWRTERKGTSYAETDRALTILKKEPDLAFHKTSTGLIRRFEHRRMLEYKARRECGTGRARLAAPGMTGTPTPRRTSWPPGWR